MEHMDHGAMRHQGMGAAKPDTGTRHKMGGMPDSVQTEKPEMAHGERREMPSMQHPGMDSTSGADSAHMQRMMDLHMLMMADSVIRRRVMADTVMRRLMHEMMAEMPAERREHMRTMMEGDARKQARPQPPAPQPRKAEAKDSAAHRGHEMPDRPEP
jgi:hypothetical protein